MLDKTINDSQHDKLRQRLEEELSYLKSSSDSADYDWFIRGSDPHPSSCSLQSPSLSDSVNNKAPPSLATSDAGLLRRNGDDMLVSLSRSKTADAKLTTGTNLSRSSTNSSNNFSSLTRTATNVGTSDIGRRHYTKPIARTVSNSTFSAPSSPPKKKGFFKKLFGAKKEEPTSPSPSQQDAPFKPRPTPTKQKPVIVTTPPVENDFPSPSSPVTRNRSSSFGSLNTASSRRRSLSFTRNSLSSKDNSLNKLKSNEIENLITPIIKDSNIELDSSAKAAISEQYKDVDPQLLSYLKEIEEANIDGENKKAEEEEAKINVIFSPSNVQHIQYDKDTIPPHPDQPNLPSALSTTAKFGGSVELELFLKQKEREKEKESSMFGGFLHKTKTNQPESTLFNTYLNESEDTPPFTFEPVKYTPPPPKYDKRPPIKILSTVKPMRKVAFATTTFVNDPPQQIPSRNPRKGNVEICPNGELIIHKIDPETKAQASTGIVVGGSGHLRLLPHAEAEKQHDENLGIDGINLSKEEMQPTTMSKTSSTASMASFDHTIRTEDKILAAKKAREHANDNAEKIDIQKEGITIDKPMVKRKRHMEKPVVTLKMDELYTRCCHLREILPIPATLKQIPKGSTDPIPFLHLRNPRPSMIEILSFTDFIRIAPIICISLDGVSLTHEMFRIVLASLLCKRYLEKLSLRNTPIDEEGWKMITCFLSMNKALKKLDITQCPTLSVNTQRIKKKSKSSNAEINRMICNVNDRSDKDWALFTASIIYRGGIDELILTGCKIPDLQLFSNLLNLSLTNTTKLGLAYNDLTLTQCEVVAKWLASHPKCIGIDLAYNDLSSHLKPFIEYADQNKGNENNLMMLSVNSCNLLDCPDTELFFNKLSKLPHLRYLDLSGNKKLFGSFMKKLTIYLPLFCELGRLNLDNNDLTSFSIVTLCECIPLFNNLSYLSIVGNKIDDSIMEALCRALKSSKTLYSVDFDQEGVNPKWLEQIGLLTMKNVEKQLYERKGLINGKSIALADLIADKNREAIRKELGLSRGMGFTQAMFELIKKKDADPKVLANFIQLASDLRERLKKIINELMTSYLKKGLSLQGKEILIRLITMDASITKGIELLHNSNLDVLNKGNNDGISNLIHNNFEHELSVNNDIDANDEVLKLINDDLNDPKKNHDKLKQALLSSSDAYDVVSMLKRLKLKNIDIGDLFVKDVQKSDDYELSDDASIDSQEFEQPEEKDNKVVHVYDSILDNIVNHSSS